MKLKAVWILLFGIAILLPGIARAEQLNAIEPLISHETRLIIFSPHPDDETLGAGGLIQRVLGAGGKVKVAFVTNGDGFPEGVEKGDHITHPSAKDFTKYGEERRLEALSALTTLGMKERDIVFLGFPDGGLTWLKLKYRLHPVAYRSPFTRRMRPPAFEVIVPRTDYCGEDLTKEMERVLAGFRPNLLAVTPAEDWHPDHSATSYFVRQALMRLTGTHPNIRPTVLTFLIHYGQWPIAQGAGTGSHLNPPDNFPDNGNKWISFNLKEEEMTNKTRAIIKYHTQMLVMGRFLLSFTRSNELFRLDSIR